MRAASAWRALLVAQVEERAAALGHRVLNLDVRETQETAIALFESLGYTALGHAPGLCAGARAAPSRGISTTSCSSPAAGAAPAS